MAHELETLANGETAFATARQSAWDRLGQISDDCITSIDSPGKWMTVRTVLQTGASDSCGVVGGDYTRVQNEEVAEVLNLLADEFGVHFETAGSMRGGKGVFITMKLLTDSVGFYLAATTSHDGTASLRTDCAKDYEVRATRALTNAGTDLKARAFELLKL